MAKMNQRIREIFENQQNVVLGTATKNGAPNVVPIGAKKIIDDETILISDQFFNKTLANMKDNPQVAITCWENMEGYQIKGNAVIETSGQIYQDTARWIEEPGKQINMPIKSKGAVLVKVTEIYDVSPGPRAGVKVA
jgi:predicted pyridoxine 5'-phosphate oxidase superfamily flavin-nucleotide-binding protein